MGGKLFFVTEGRKKTHPENRLPTGFRGANVVPPMGLLTLEYKLNTKTQPIKKRKAKFVFFSFVIIIFIVGAFPGGIS